MARTDPGGDPVVTFMQLMWDVDHELQIVSKRMEASLGLTGPQRLALLAIGQQPELSAGELATRLRLDPSTITGLIRRLDDAGLVRRVWDAQDARRMRLTLTPRGRQANRLRSGTVEGAVRRALARTSDRDRAATGRMMNALAVELRRSAATCIAQARARARRRAG